MDKTIETIEKWDSECKEALSDAESTADAVLEPLTDRFKREVTECIPQSFGDFLYDSLGDRVTGQRSSVLNQTFFDEHTKGKLIKDEASKAGKSIEEFLRDEQNKNGYNSQTPSYQRRWSEYTQVQLYLTVGRKFGVSYFTGDKGRVHTIYFGKGCCFTHLMQGHIDCIKDKEKKRCAQAFLDFRTKYIDGLNALNAEIIRTPVEVDTAIVSTVHKGSRFGRNSYYGSSSKNFTILEGIEPQKITHCAITLPTIDLWDSVTTIDSRKVGHDKSREGESQINALFYNVDKDAKEIVVVADLEIGKETRHTLTNINSDNRQAILETTGSAYYGLNVPRHIKDAYPHHKVVSTDKIVIEFEKIMHDPNVKRALDKRIDFYATMSAELIDLKHEFAGLFFVNGDL